MIIKCHPSTAAKLKEGKTKSLTKIQLKIFSFDLKIQEEESANIYPGRFKFISAKSGEDLTHID